MDYGKDLNQLITHKKKTKKYMYEKTALQSSLSDENLRKTNFNWRRRNPSDCFGSSI